MLSATALEITRDHVEEAERLLGNMLERAGRMRTRTLEAARAAPSDETHLEALRWFAIAAECRERNYQHTERVGRTSGLLAEQLGLGPRYAALIEQAAPLHDLGKLTVPRALLLKPGRLTPSEWERMRRHTLDGAAILAGATNELLRMAREIALSHHERWDGRGYPHGLRGPAIPLSARIVALADTFDALTDERPYKRPWPVERALEEIRAQRGRHFDPLVVDCFEQLDPYELAPVMPLMRQLSNPEGPPHAV
jgi:putative two-component system response regulator